MQANAASRGWWQAPSDQISGGLLQGGLRQLTAMLEKDPILRAIEDGLNVNPLHDVIPVDWAEIVRALRSIWLLKMSRPGKAMAGCGQPCGDADTAPEATRARRRAGIGAPRLKPSRPVIETLPVGIGIPSACAIELGRS